MTKVPHCAFGSRTGEVARRKSYRHRSTCGLRIHGNLSSDSESEASWSMMTFQRKGKWHYHSHLWRCGGWPMHRRITDLRLQMAMRIQLLTNILTQKSFLVSLFTCHYYIILLHWQKSPLWYALQCVGIAESVRFGSNRNRKREHIYRILTGI